MHAAPENLKLYAGWVESALDELFPEEVSLLQKELFTACRYSLLGGGKRLRIHCLSADFHRQLRLSQG